jgi:hypothetical protein
METTKKERIVKVTFTGLNATVTVKDLDESMDFDIDSLSDEIKTFLIQYGWKQKVSDFRAADKLKGQEKLDAIIDCHKMLQDGETRIKGETVRMSTEDQFVEWQKMSDETKDSIKLINPALHRKMTKLEE